MEQRVQKNSTTTIVTYPRLRPGLLLQAAAAGSPSPQVKVWTASTSPSAYGEATRDTLSSSVTASTPAGSTSVSVASATWVYGRRYILAQPGQEPIVVESRTGGTAESLDLAQPLPFAVDDTASITGFALTRALTADETSQVGPGSALWQATVDGIKVEWSQLFRVVTRITTALLTPSDLTKAYSSLLAMTPPTDTSLEEAIAAAWEHRVVPLLEAKQVFDEDIISDETIVPLHALAVVRHLYAYDPRVEATFIDRLKDDWEEMVSTTFARITFAERPQDVAPTPLVPMAEAPRGRMRLRP
jgi:hypothetical protein